MLINKQCQMTLTFTSNGLPFWFVNVVIISSNSVLEVSKIRNYLIQHLTNKHNIYLLWKCIILQIFIDIDYLLNYIGLKLFSTTSRIGTFSLFYVFCINLFVLPSNFIVSGACNSSLYLSFILKTNLLLILLM